ncbi:hypothetical protein OSJ77_10475, partial [Phyllobacterium sp. 0TCS1.6C]|uniref:hypothetical protein n=1 Tax=Phyllobacterium sp. 0TCS1.6C TaxID=2995638 RepID=UPI0022650841
NPENEAPPPFPSAVCLMVGVVTSDYSATPSFPSLSKQHRKLLPHWKGPAQNTPASNRGDKFFCVPGRKMSEISNLQGKIFF